VIAATIVAEIAIFLGTSFWGCLFMMWLSL
jgi:hypothetical protein